MKRAFVLVLPMLTIAAIACLGRTQMAQERLRDAVVGYNDELRFGRMDLAVQRVAPALRGQFVGSHYRWGRDIAIADTEIVNVEAVGEDFDHAVSFVSFRWYPTGTTIIRETLVREEWRKDRTVFVLVGESAVDGDPALLEIPQGFRPETSGLMPENDADAGPDAAIPDAGTPDATPR